MCRKRQVQTQSNLPCDVVRTHCSMPMICNVASSGQKIAAMIDSLGIVGQVAVKTTRRQTGVGVLGHLHASELNNEVVFAQATEIRVQIDKGLGVKLPGPLPKRLEIATTCQPALSSGACCNASPSDFPACIAFEVGKRIARDADVD